MLHNLVREPFTKRAHIPIEELVDTINTAVEMLDAIIDINKFPDPIYEHYQKRFRTIGLGVTGLADALVMLGFKYNTQEARKFVSDLMEIISYYAYKRSMNLAKEKGAFEGFSEAYVKNGWLRKQYSPRLDWDGLRTDIKNYGVRNSKIMSVAPTGTMSLTFGNNCSSGMEPIFSLEYDRKVKFGGQDEKDAQVIKMRDYAYDKWLAFKDDPDCVVTRDCFVTALEMSVNDHVDMLAAIAFHVDMSVSKTINIPSDYSFEDTKEVYMRCWRGGVKGCTIFRPNEVRQGVFNTEEPKASAKEKEACSVTLSSLPRGVIINCSDNLVGKKRKLTTGCGTGHLSIWYDEDGKIYETFFDKGSTGGCRCNQEAVSRLMSLALRGGVPIEDVIDQLMSCGGCDSYRARTVSKHDTSKGSSCPTAIAYSLKEMMEELKEEYGEYDEEELKERFNKAIEAAKPMSKCPECGEELRFEGGCNVCPSCGWSKCG